MPTRLLELLMELFTKVNGRKMASDMGKENRYGMTEVYMKVHGSMITLKDGADLFMLMVMYMKESGRAIWQMV